MCVCVCVFVRIVYTHKHTPSPTHSSPSSEQSQPIKKPQQHTTILDQCARLEPKSGCHTVNRGGFGCAKGMASTAPWRLGSLCAG